MAHDILVAVLGGFDVGLDGRPVPDAAWRRNRARTLVKLLALARGQRLHREQIMDALWPSLDGQAAAGNLRKAIHFARQALGAEHIRTHGELIALEAPTLRVDVHEFEAAARAGLRTKALALYRGDLLPEDRFEPWAEDPRERLRTRFHKLLVDEAASLEQGGSLEAAADILDRLVASDPLHEDAHLALMRVLASAGARHSALARYRQLEDRLRTELDVETAPAVRRLYDDIASGRFPPAGAAPGPPTTPSPSSREGPVGEDERRLVTALSAAIVVNPDDPELGRRELDAWTASGREIVESWGGMAETRAGGDLMVVFGVPSGHEDDAARALHAALEMIERTPGSSRIGISTGEVIAAAGGGAPLRGITGAVVAQAASLREAAEFGAVLVADRTERAAGAGFRFSDPMTVRIGGEPTAARRLLAKERAVAQALLTEPPVIGRDPEIAAVLGLFEEAIVTRRPRLVELSGPAGVGKSRLAREVIARIAERWPEAMILRGRCLAGGRGSTFGALGEIVREACGIPASDNAGQAEQRLRRGLARLLGELEPADVEPTTFSLATTAGIALASNPLDSLPPAEVADRLGLAWPVLASACAAMAPAVFLIEDLHWARPELLDMIEHIVTRSRGPLFVLLTARPELHEARPVFGTGGDDFSTIAIRPLGSVHSEELLDSLLVGDLPESGVRRDLLARAEGNPFYLEQLTHHLRSGGAAGLPDTLQSLLAARMDALPVAERRVLQQAAVVGRVFWDAPIGSALTGERVGPRLAALERKGYVVRHPHSSLPGQAEFAIRHALLHDVAYESLPRARRARAHAATGAWLESLAGDRVDEVIDLLAHHYWSALSPSVPELAPDDGMDREGIRIKAFSYAMRAGDEARLRFITDRAVALHRRAESLAADDDERLPALEALARDHEDAFKGDEAAIFYRQALVIARRDQVRSEDRARLCRRLAWMMAWMPGAFGANPDADEAEALADEGMAHVVDDAERAWLTLVRGACARLYRGSEPLGQGKYPDPRPITERIAAAQEALSAARSLGRDDIVAAAIQALGMLFGLAGKYEAMIELAQRQVAELRPEQSRIDQSDAIRKLALHLINIRADFEQGLDLGERCRNLLGVSGAGGPHQLMHVLWPILCSLFYLGRWQDMLAPLGEHIEAFRAEPAVFCQAVRDGPAIGAAVLTLLGRHAEASKLAELLGDPLLDRDSASAWQARQATIGGDPAVARAISQDKGLEGRGYGPQHAFALLEALSVLGEWDAARAFLPVARRTIPGNALLGPMCDRVDGLLKLADGDAGHAAPLLRRAVRGFRRFNIPYEEAQTLEGLARAAPADAASARSAALAIYDRLGVGPDARTWRALIQLNR